EIPGLLGAAFVGGLLMGPLLAGGLSVDAKRAPVLFGRVHAPKETTKSAKVSTVPSVIPGPRPLMNVLVRISSPSQIIKLASQAWRYTKANRESQTFLL
ncbi:MAG TPA: hypothetical protein DC054_05380, partial [Blastocatellia bacterium]|nr:hypothetical protein [Blastocatellia bacterium]